MRTGSPPSSATCRWPSPRRPGSWPRPAWRPRSTWSLLRTRAGQLLDQGAPGSYPRSLAAATQLIADRLAGEDPAAAELASLCAFLAPEPIPEDLFTGAASELPGELAARAADPLAWRQTLARLARQSLARIDHRGLQMHRLTQAILRDRLTPDQAAATRARTEAILAASNPGDPANPGTWPRWARLMPHLLAADLAATDSPALRWLACNACWYLLARGDTRTGHDLASDLRQQWRDRLGDDHEHVLAIAHYLAWALREMGRYAEARDLNQDTLDRNRRVLGEDHPDTLRSANTWPSTCAAWARCRPPATWTRTPWTAAAGSWARTTPTLCAPRVTWPSTCTPWARCRPPATWTRTPWTAAPGPGRGPPRHPVSATNLAADLRDLGEVQAARDLDQDTLDRSAGSWARTTPTPWSPRITLPSTCAPWARCRPPATWTRTPWTAAAGSWARTTPTLWPPRITWPSTCAPWARRMMTPEAVINTTAIMQTRQPEKRKVDSSILSLTTTLHPS